MKRTAGVVFLSLLPVSASPGTLARRPVTERVTIDSIATSRPWYERGDTIVLHVSAEPGLRLSADFSAVDSSYRAGAERVVDLETGYRIDYRLSRDNGRPSGDYEVRVAADDSFRNRKTQSVDVRYLPEGRANVILPQASFRAHDPDTRRRRDDRIRIGGPRFVADLKGIPGPPEPKLFDDSRGIPAGTRLQIEVDLPRLGPSAVVSLELRQVGTSGHFAVPIDTSRPASCAGNFCQYAVELTMQHELAEDKVFSVQIGLYDTATAHHAMGGARQLAWSLDCDSDPETVKPYCQEPTGVYRIYGTITHDRRVLGADPGGSPHEKALQYEYSDLFTSVAPAREVMVRVANGCGLHHDTYTNSEGDCSVAFESWCGDKDATVTLYSVSAPGAGKQVALGLYTASPAPQVLGDLVDDPDLYTVISGEVGTFNPEADAIVAESCLGGFCFGGKELDEHFFRFDDGALYEAGKLSRSGEVARALTILENVMMALDYYRQLVSGSKLPQINVVLTNGALAESDNFAMYSKSNSNLIYLPPDMEWSIFGLLHETGHYFDGGVLVKDGLLNYGRWGEPMANVRAGMILGTPWMAAREFTVNLQYLPQNSGAQHAEYEDRGQSGPDLVDVLDGFACLYGMSQLQMMTMLHEVMSYHYDFGKCSDPIFTPGN